METKGKREKLTYGKEMPIWKLINIMQTAIDQTTEKVALERGDKRLECEARLWLGNTYQRIGEYQTAIENHEQKIHWYRTAVGFCQKAQEIALKSEDKFKK